MAQPETILQAEIMAALGPFLGVVVWSLPSQQSRFGGIVHQISEQKVAERRERIYRLQRIARSESGCLESRHQTGRTGLEKSRFRP